MFLQINAYEPFNSSRIFQLLNFFMPDFVTSIEAERSSLAELMILLFSFWTFYDKQCELWRDWNVWRRNCINASSTTNDRIFEEKDERWKSRVVRAMRLKLSFVVVSHVVLQESKLDIQQRDMRKMTERRTDDKWKRTLEGTEADDEWMNWKEEEEENGSQSPKMKDTKEMRKMMNDPRRVNKQESIYTGFSTRMNEEWLRFHMWTLLQSSHSSSPW